MRQLFGDRQNHCYTSPVYREKVRAMDQALAKRAGDIELPAYGTAILEDGKRIL